MEIQNIKPGDILYVVCKQEDYKIEEVKVQSIMQTETYEELTLANNMMFIMLLAEEMVHHPKFQFFMTRGEAEEYQREYV